MTDLALSWSSEQREAVQEFCLRACRSIYLAENDGDVIEAIHRMLEIAVLPWSYDEEELEAILNLDGPGLWE